jgi:hypothetical protein
MSATKSASLSKVGRRTKRALSNDSQGSTSLSGRQDALTTLFRPASLSLVT